MQKLTESLRQLKESQSDALSIIPHQTAVKESAEFAKCNTLENVLEESKSHNIPISDIPLVSLLRCGISEKPSPNTEELFQLLEGKIPWLLSEEGTYMQVGISVFYFTFITVVAAQALGDVVNIPVVQAY